MDNVNIKLVNCYGIKRLEYSFDFKKRKNYLLYASNGMMKTSFTKVFKCLSSGKKPSDEVFQRKTICEVKVDEASIDKNDIFVINSYEDEYISPNSAKLMVQKDLRAKYDAAISSLKIAREACLSAIGQTINEGDNAVNVLADFLHCEPLDVIDELCPLVESGLLAEERFHVDFSKIKYSDLFSAEVKKFISDPKNLDQIKEYEERYNELIEASPIFKRGVFSHNNATTISENLSANGFFNAEHKLLLHGIQGEIKSSEELTMTLEAEKKKIFSDDKLKNKFEKINTLLGKKALVKFRSAIEAQQEIISQLSEFETFKRKVWVDVLYEVQEQVQSAIIEYKKCQAAIGEVKEQAKRERTQWDKVLEVFKTRFSAPFMIEVPNRNDVAFADKMPEFIFKYVDSETNETIEIQRKELERVLSQGEKRALYLLNIINDLEALKLSNRPCLIIADDIAESFDYKNKYAIIEYLQEMMMNENFHFIILTHNFDFYRTLASRLRNLIFAQMVQRKTDGLEITDPKYVFKNPFENIKKGMYDNDDKDIITAIPFIRNLIEYTCGDGAPNYKILTALLHIKPETKEINFYRLQNIFNNELKLDKQLTFANGRETESVYKKILELAKEISIDNRETIDLTGKIIISMAVRLLAEEYMIACLTNNGQDSLEPIFDNQTGTLLKRYKAKFPDKTHPISVLNRVLLMSSENIHLNSFMFEPLIDISIRSLIALYGEVLILVH